MTLATAFGSFTGATQQQASATPLPTTLGGVQITVAGTPAPLLYTSTGQINFIVPAVSPRQGAEVAVTVNGNLAGSTTLAIVDRKPYIFLQDNTASRPALALNPNGVVNGQSAPAAAGGIVYLYVTGMGATESRPEVGAMLGLYHGTNLTAEPIAMGVWRVPVPIPAAGVQPGPHPVAVHSQAATSNTATVWLQ